MATARHKRRLHSGRDRRRLAAINFLSNISLDGTHNDTKLSIFNSASQAQDGRSDGLSPDAVLLLEESGTGGVVGSHGSSSSSSAAAASTSDRLLLPPQSQTNIATVQSVVTDRLTNITETSADVTSVSPSAATVVQPVATHKEEHFAISKRWSPCQDSASKEGPSSAVLRASSYSGDRERMGRKKSAHSHDVKVSSEKITDRLRRSSSISVDSSDSGSRGTKEIKFILPDRLKRRFFRNERFVMVSKKKVPLLISSTLAYNRASQHGIRRPDGEEAPVVRVRNTSGTSIRPVSVFEDMLTFGLLTLARTEDGQDVSYGEFLVPSHYQHLTRPSPHDPCLPTLDGQGHPFLVHRSFSHDPSAIQRHGAAPTMLEKVSEEGDLPYDPYVLDDPELSSGSYRTLMTFPSYITSVIDYVRPSELKKELNEKFRLKFPQIQLTLSKLRSLKRELKQIANDRCGVDLWTVAQSYVFFEKLILKHLINKANRKLCAGACLMLSAKLNDVKGPELTKLLQCLEDELRLHRKEMLAYEVAVLIALEFSLHISDQQIYPHYQRLLYNS